MTFSCNLAGLFAKIWVQTFWGWIADSRKGYARLSPVSSLPLGKLVRSCRRSYRYVSMIIYSSVLLSNCLSYRYEFSIHFSGARSQASKTYLEKFQVQMDNFSLQDLILLALRALKEATSEPLTKETCTVAVVGVEIPFRVLNEDELSSPLAKLTTDTQ